MGTALLVLLLCTTISRYYYNVLLQCTITMYYYNVLLQCTITMRYILLLYCYNYWLNMSLKQEALILRVYRHWRYANLKPSINLLIYQSRNRAAKRAGRRRQWQKQKPKLKRNLLYFFTVWTFIAFEHWGVQDPYYDSTPKRYVCKVMTNLLRGGYKTVGYF